MLGSELYSLFLAVDELHESLWQTDKADQGLQETPPRRSMVQAKTGKYAQPEQLPPLAQSEMATSQVEFGCTRQATLCQPPATTGVSDDTGFVSAQPTLWRVVMEYPNVWI